MAYDKHHGDGGSSTSVSTSGWTYDVFLSFAGQDTRYGFTGHLYNALCQKGIKTFMDTKLERGEKISHALIDAIEQSRIAMVVLSENYAESPWCLDELVKIVACKGTKGQIVSPVFYHVEPSDVRHARNSYGKALAEHKRKFEDNKEKVDKWRSALQEVSNFSGWTLKKGERYEHELIIDIVADVYGKIKSTALLVAKYPVGLEPRISEVRCMLELNSDRVAMVGICGMGGIGKTTIARGLYNTLEQQYGSSCFLGDVRENAGKSLVSLQKKLLSEVMGDDENINDVDEGKSKIALRLRHKKVLLVLDDVDDLEQLEALAGGQEWFGKGSRIIITTRDRHLLRCHGLGDGKIWEARGLNDEEALELFCWAAFKRSTPDTTCADISGRIVQYCKGLPLVLKVIGSDLSGRRRYLWESAFEQYRSFPIKNIHDVLKVSYDNLEDNLKEIFLDIACFFKGSKLDGFMHILDACGIEKLVDKSLIYIHYNTICMHDQIQEMGWKIVQQQSPRSRLWNQSDVVHVLESDSGSEQIQGILLEGKPNKELSGKAFRKMRNLRILIIRGNWFSEGPTYLPSGSRMLDRRCYPLSSLPNLRLSKISQRKIENANLKYLDFTSSNIEEIPDVSGIPYLSEIRADSCRNLKKVHDSVGFLEKLVMFSARDSHSIRSFPRKLTSKVMESLDISGDWKINRFPEVLVEMGNIKSIWMAGTSVRELPPSFGNLVGVEFLQLNACKCLKNIPRSFFALQNLKQLNMAFCELALKAFRQMSEEGSIGRSSTSREMHTAMVLPNLVLLDMASCDLTDEDIPLLLSCFPNLHELCISLNDRLWSLPPCFKEFLYLANLDVQDCCMLQEISEIPPNIRSIKLLGCQALDKKSFDLLESRGLHNTEPCLYYGWSLFE